jgi:HSP20 family protein
MKTLPSLFERNLGSAVTRSPFRSLINLQRRMDQLMNESFPEAWGESALEAGFEPLCDVEEYPAHYQFSFDLPGIKKENLSIEITADNELMVKGERKAEKETKTGSVQQRERMWGAFERSFLLPKSVKADQIEAQYRDGVLQVMIPKSEPTQSRQIKITEGKIGVSGEKH